MQHLLGINSGGLLLALTRRRQYLCIPRVRFRCTQVPSPRPVIWGSQGVGGPSQTAAPNLTKSGGSIARDVGGPSQTAARKETISDYRVAGCVGRPSHHPATNSAHIIARYLG